MYSTITGYTLWFGGHKQKLHNFNHAKSNLYTLNNIRMQERQHLNTNYIKHQFYTTTSNIMRKTEEYKSGVSKLIL